MNKITAISLSTLTALGAGSAFFTAPASANFGNFMLGAGVGAGSAILINNSQNQRRQRYGFVPPEQEFTRGRQDGFNGAKYDNPRNSNEYTRGFQEGLRMRRG
ncbi:hypothetical protein C7H19_00735 [Aphanothece hegewaldii CCALA 016]|uniref:Uncharacterized protein n=1 Tax=Aphanothece hegewaldii CCALA 016 TaxID=2107694 RepID=A0A2T1M3D5_9CHRO|nr:hypothetical protein [Aphanothece hegewaldii]PSF39347.1 hypothetical protein C7H19_00735 [Aphanothece hegewaldii CCALA 016]